MPVRPMFIITASLMTAVYSIICIYKLAMSPANAMSDVSSFLIFDPVFWFWTAVAWLSSYLLIRSYLLCEWKNGRLIWMKQKTC